MNTTYEIRVTTPRETYSYGAQYMTTAATMIAAEHAVLTEQFGAGRYTVELEEVAA